MLKYDFSVVICTQNRGEELAQTLSSLVESDLPQFKGEVLIIDNGSTSANQAIYQGLVKEHPLFHNHFTSISGLSHARNLGLQFAQGQYVCFFDDKIQEVHYNNYPRSTYVAFRKTALNQVK